ncbi:MAG: contractile injection system tape measure protein [Gilvibacter sp.]
MNSQKQHIVKRLLWQTVLDQKEAATELQNTLSDWTHYRLSLAATGVLDSFCSEDQVWKIDSLELDLGVCTLEELKEQLETRFLEAITLRLRQMLLYSHRPENRIEIVSNQHSYLGFVAHFLESGTYSWVDYQQETSINNLLLKLLEEQTHKTLKMLKISGQKQQVRKRLAFQIKSEVLRMVVTKLEPSYATEVFDFIEEVTTIQQQSNLVHETQSQFAKNMWYWVLTHLLVERGSAFNQKEFAKSTLVQMGNHINTSYEDLIILIDTALTNSNLNQKAAKQLVITIKTLKSELVGKTTVGDSKAAYKQIDALLRMEPNKLSSAQIQALNRQLTKLSRSDAKGVNTYLITLFKKQKLSHDFLKTLQISTMAALISILDLGSAKTLKLQLAFLSRGISGKHAKKQLSRVYGSVFTNILKSLQSGTSAQTSEAQLQQLLIEVWAQTTRIKEAAIKYMLTGHETKSEPEAVAVLALRKHLEQNQGTISNASSIAAFASIASKLRQARLVDQDAPEAIKAKNALLYWLGKHQDLAIEALLSIAHKDDFNTLLHGALHPIMLDNLFAKSKDPRANFIQNLIALILDESAKGQLQPIKMAQLKELLNLLSLEVVFGQESFDQQEFVERLAQMISFVLSNNDSQIFKANLIKAIERFDQLQQQQVLSLTKHIQKTFDSSRTLAQVLKTSVPLSVFIKHVQAKQDSVFSFKTHLTSTELLVLKRIFGDAHKQLVGFYTEWLTKGQRSIKQRAKIFWNCVFDVTTHQGDAKQLKVLIAQTIRKPKPFFNSTKVTIVGKDKAKELPVNNTTFIKYVKEAYSVPNSNYRFGSLVVSAQHLFVAALSQQPRALVGTIKSLPLHKNRIALLASSLSFESFLNQMSLISALDQTWSHELLVLQRMAQLKKDNQQRATPYFWKIALNGIIRPQSKNTQERIISETVTAFELDSMAFVQVLDKVTPDPFKVSPRLQQLFDVELIAEGRIEEQVNPVLATGLLNKLNDNALMHLTAALITSGKVPANVVLEGTIKAPELLMHLVQNRPDILKIVLSKKGLDPYVLDSFIAAVSFELQLKMAYILTPERQEAIKQFELFCYGWRRLSIPGVSVAQIKTLAEQLLLETIINGQWDKIKANRVWEVLIWRLRLQYGLDRAVILEAINDQVSGFSFKLQGAFKVIYSNYSANQQNNIKPMDNTQIPFFETIPLEGIAVKNAGMVLINSYYPLLLNRLGLVENNRFVSDQAQLDATHYLQFVATGQSHTEEGYLALNKVLCGLPLNTPLLDGVAISDANIELIEGLVSAAVSHWPTVGESSVDGFRGNWLVRDGILYDQGDRWELIVEKKAPDILINQAPYSFSIIKFPWMDKPLHVNWPY